MDGVQELADKIFAARAQKPIYAIADSTCASAALWLAASATMFFSTPAGGGYTVGSVGCYVLHVDKSAALEKEGVKITMISAGTYKTELNSLGPPSKEGVAEVLRTVIGITANFTAALKRGRNTTAENVRSNFGQGRMLTAAAALAVGMIDRVISYGDLIAKLTGDGTGSSSSGAPTANGARSEELRRRFELNRHN